MVVLKTYMTELWPNENSSNNWTATGMKVASLYLAGQYNELVLPVRVCVCVCVNEVGNSFFSRDTWSANEGMTHRVACEVNTWQFHQLELICTRVAAKISTSPSYPGRWESGQTSSDGEVTIAQEVTSVVSLGVWTEILERRWNHWVVLL